MTPLVFSGEPLFPNGIDGLVGQPLLNIDTAIAAIMAQTSLPTPAEVTNLYKDKKLMASGAYYGVKPDFSQSTLEEARWAVVMHANEDVALLKALWPLIDHRMRQMGFSKLDFDFQSSDTTCGAWLARHTDAGKKSLQRNWGEIPPVLLMQGSETTNKWLARHGVSQGMVDPRRGVPLYLMIAARPGPINATDKVFLPLNFQHELDTFWCVGRLVFSDENGQHRLSDYRAYAERLVAWETRPDAARRLRKEIAFFGTRHENDTATTYSADDLVGPLVDWSKTSKTATQLGVGQTVYLGKNATRSNLERLLSASTPPALLFAASHGIGLPMSDPTRLVRHQGALLTADFKVGRIKREHWLAGEDLDALRSANIEGMIAVLFASYGAGCPKEDTFISGVSRPQIQVAPFPFIAQLPQRMLAKGALAVMGHVDRAWPYRPEADATSQVQPFEAVISQLLQGIPVGYAFDQFNIVQAERALALIDELEQITYGAWVDLTRLSRLWMACNDVQRYVLLGDPAVKLAIA